MLETVKNVASNVGNDLLDTVVYSFNSNSETKEPFDSKEFLGLPPSFIASADPNKRIYSKTMLADMPMVMLVPGKPIFFAHDKEFKKNQEDTEESMLDRIAKFDDDDEAGVVEWLKESTSSMSNRDIRYYSFQPDYADYFTYVNTMLSTLAVKMGVSDGLYTFSEDFRKGLLTSGIKYFAEKSSSVTESASNEFGSSKLEGITKGASGLMREMKFLLGIDAVGNTSDPEKQEKRNTRLDETMNNLADSGFIGSMAGNVGTVMGGANVLFPEIWNDSKFTRNYNLTFKFASPSGDKMSIFKYVYVPFLTLLALSLPRQSSLTGYYSPFLLRVDSPGHFSTDMGVCTSLTYKKGGNDKLFNKDGLPLEIEVTMSIKDLYPTLIASNSYKVLRHNQGLAGFLNNMAGLSVDRLNVLDRLGEHMKSLIGSASGSVDHVSKVFKQSAYKGWADTVKKTLGTNN